MTRHAALAAMALLTLGACGGPAPTAEADSQDRFAGLDTEVRTWREALLEGREGCAGASADHACRGFTVACKGEREITGEETAAGMTAKVVSAMTFEAWDPARAEYLPASAFAEFTKSDGKWSRAETGPVNLSTCAGT